MRVRMSYRTVQTTALATTPHWGDSVMLPLRG